MTAIHTNITGRRIGMGSGDSLKIKKEKGMLIRIQTADCMPFPCKYSPVPMVATAESV